MSVSTTVSSSSTASSSSPPKTITPFTRPSFTSGNAVSHPVSRLRVRPGPAGDPLAEAHEVVGDRTAPPGLVGAAPARLGAEHPGVEVDDEQRPADAPRVGPGRRRSAGAASAAVATSARVRVTVNCRLRIRSSRICSRGGHAQRPGALTDLLDQPLHGEPGDPGDHRPEGELGELRPGAVDRARHHQDRHRRRRSRSRARRGCGGSPSRRGAAAPAARRSSRCRRSTCRRGGSPRSTPSAGSPGRAGGAGPRGCRARSPG